MIQIYFTAFLFLFDFFAKYFLNDTNPKSRWFLIHFVGNIAIAISCMGSVWSLLHDPIHTLMNPTTNNLPLDLVTILHIYHLARYECTTADYFHHFLFVTAGNIIRFTTNSGEILPMTVVFVCGFPGAIDYMALYLIDKKIISKHTRINISVVINTWIRAPGLMFCFTLQYIAWMNEPKTLVNNMMFLCGSIVTFFNGQYYLQQVLLTAGKKYSIVGS